MHIVLYGLLGWLRLRIRLIFWFGLQNIMGERHAVHNEVEDGDRMRQGPLFSALREFDALRHQELELPRHKGEKHCSLEALS